MKLMIRKQMDLFPDYICVWSRNYMVIYDGHICETVFAKYAQFEHLGN